MNPMVIAALIGLAPSLISLLFGGKNSDKTQTVTENVSTPPRGIQDPTLGLLLPYMTSTLLGGMNQYSGAGMPGGIGSNSPFGGDIMNILMQNWPDFLNAYKTGGNQAKQRIPYNPKVMRRDSIRREA